MNELRKFRNKISHILKHIFVDFSIYTQFSSAGPISNRLRMSPVKIALKTCFFKNPFSANNIDRNMLQGDDLNCTPTNVFLKCLYNTGVCELIFLTWFPSS